MLGVLLFFRREIYSLFDFLIELQEHKEVLRVWITSFWFWGPFIFIGIQISQVVLSPVPGELTGLLGGYLYGAWLSSIYSTIGLTIGSWIAFMLGRILGRSYIQKLISKKLLQKFEFLTTNRGSTVVLNLFLIPGFPKDIMCFLLGISPMNTVIFTLLGGLFAIRSGVIKAMFVSGILMASTNLLFSLLAWSGKSELLFAIAVIFDDMAAAFATVAFVAFISMLVDRTYTATQYALLASIGTAGRTTLAASSGAMVDWLNGDWGIFFIITAIMVIPSLIFLYFIKNDIKLSEK